MQYYCQWVAGVLQLVRTSAGDNSVQAKIRMFWGDFLRGKAFCHHCYHLCYHYNFLSNLLQTNHLLILVIAVIAKRPSAEKIAPKTLSFSHTRFYLSQNALLFLAKVRTSCNTPATHWQ